MRVVWLLAAVTVAVSRPAEAQSRWFSIVVGDGIRVALDTTRIVADSGSWSAWTDWVYAKPQKATVAGKQKTYVRSISKWDMDCAKQRYRTMSSVQYDADGETVENVDNSQYFVPWRDPIPDSYGEVVVRAACRVVTGAYRRDVDEWLRSIAQRDSTRRDVCSWPKLKADAVAACRAAFAPNMPLARGAYLDTKLDSVLGLQRLPDMPRP